MAAGRCSHWQRKDVILATIPPLRTGRKRRFSGRDDNSVEELTGKSDGDGEIEEGFSPEAGSE